jgi:outer membrane protein TolC
MTRPGLSRWVSVLLVACGCVRTQLPEARVISVHSQEPLAWRRAVEMALAQHPELRQARAEMEAQLHNRNQALGAYLPTVEGTATQRTTDTGSSSDDSLALALDVSVPLFTGLENTGEAIRAWRNWEAARWSYVETSAAVRRALRAAFVEQLRLHQLLDVNRRIALRRRDNADLIRLRYEAGREHEGSWRRADAIAGQAEFEVRQTERRMASQSLTLGRELGGAFATGLPVEGSLEHLVPSEPGAPQDYAALAGRTPTVQRLTRSAEALKAAVVTAQAELWPTAEGTYTVGASGPDSSDLEDTSTLGVTVSVPVFNGGRNVSGVFESRAAYRAAVEAARSERDQRIAELSSQWTLFRDAWEFVAVRRAFLDAARQRAEIVRAQYTSGLADFQDFDIAEQELADSERAYVQSLADVLTEEADWTLTTGGTLEEALSEAVDGT